MSKTSYAAASLFFAVLYTILFYDQFIGINLALAELLFLAWSYFTNRIDLKNRLTRILIASVIATSIGVVVVNSSFVIIMNFVAVTAWVGANAYPEMNSIFTAFKLSMANFIRSQSTFVQNTSGVMPARNRHRVRALRIYVLPAVIVYIFILLYRSANPVFADISGNIGLTLGTFFADLFSSFNLALLFTFISALIISNFLLFSERLSWVTRRDEQSVQFIHRKRNSAARVFKMLALRDEMKSGVFLLIVLNSLLLGLNALDIYYVWFNFSWDGNYLKEFVHEGTYYLLISILSSIAIVLYYFRGNINFYSRNRIFKLICYIWIAQNVILTISVGVRNYWYIQHFALAYKRIGLLIFLILTVYGLFTVYKKIAGQRSAFYLFRTNGLALFCVLSAASLINWDAIIVRYNFASSQKSFVHLDYLVTFTDKTLPYLQQDLNWLRKIKTRQEKTFALEEQFMSAEEYHQIIERRKKDFIQRWESQGIFSWNLPEYRAYQLLKSG